MALHNTLALAEALKPTVMKQGCYSSQEFEDFRELRSYRIPGGGKLDTFARLVTGAGFIRDLIGPHRLQAQ